jgi:AAA family ATP:ADP antiporter
MDSIWNRVITRLTNTRSGERTVAFLMFAYSFLAMTSHNILKPVTKSKFIDQLGSDNLPYVLLASSVLIGMLMHFYASAARRVPRKYVIPITQAILVALLVLFWALLRNGAAWVTVALYFFGQILGILLLSQFWTLANDVYDARQAKRLFGLIGGGACLGGAVGAAITATRVEAIGSNNLLLVSAITLSICVVLVLKIVRLPHAEHQAEELDERGVGGREAFRLLAQSRHLRVLAGVVAFAAIGAAVVDQQLSMAAEGTGADGDAIAKLLAQVTIYLSLAGFLVQIGLTSRIHRSFGIAVALLLLPIGLGTSATLILLTGQLWAVAGARVLDTTLRYSLDKTTREVLFIPLPADLRFRAKPFIDVTMDRFGKAAAAAIILVLIHPRALGLDWRQLSYASLIVMAGWIAMALVAWREYIRAFRASVVSQGISPTSIRANVADTATIETLVEELSSPDERSVIYAIDLLEALDKRNLVTPLLLQSESPRVRARSLRVMAAVGSSIAERWIPTIERMVQDEDVEVRAAALHALAKFSHEDAAVLLRRHLDDIEPRVAVTAAIALANSGRAEDVDAAEMAFLRTINDSRETNSGARGEAAKALGHVAHPRFRPLVVPLLNDSDISVGPEGDQERSCAGSLGRTLRSGTVVVARPPFAQGAGTRGARRIWRDDRSSAGVLARRQAGATLDQASHPGHPGVDRDAGSDGRARRSAQRGRRIPALQGHHGDREAATREPVDLLSATDTRDRRRPGDLSLLQRPHAAAQLAAARARRRRLAPRQSVGR